MARATMARPCASCLGTWERAPIGLLLATGSLISLVSGLNQDVWGHRTWWISQTDLRMYYPRAFRILALPRFTSWNSPVLGQQ